MFSRLSATEPRTGLSDIKPLDQRLAQSAAIDGRLPPPIMPAGPGSPVGASANQNGPGGSNGASVPQGSPAGSSGLGNAATRSIIGSDLTIVGQGLRIITRGTLQVDGTIEGDVIGNEVIIGERGHVTGVVSGESVTVRGQVQGTIKAVTVSLQSGAHVEGDVHHRQLSVEQGAHLDGRVRRPQDLDELKPDLNIA
jgi:cytoskeletal protein CcmA (bactofilin family)